MTQVSVIIPCFNGGEYLAQAIQSVLDQTYALFEIIVVDDGSTDDSAAIAASFEDRGVRYIYQENQGAASARNTGIRASDCDYIAFLDSDDLYYPQKLETQVKFLDDHPDVGVVIGGSAYIDADGNLLKEVESWKWSGSLGLDGWVMSCLAPVHAALIRHRWLVDDTLFDESFRASEDWDFWLRLSRAGCPMAWIERMVAKYRMRGNSMSRDVKRLRDRHLQALDKLFADKLLPIEIVQKKSLAYARVHIRAAATAYAIGEVELGKEEIDQALVIEPSAFSDPSGGGQILRWMAHHVTVADAEQYLRVVQENLPPRAGQLREQIRIALADEYLGRAFTAHGQGQPKEVKRLVKLAVGQYPACLFNRGVLTIGAEVYLGQRVVRQLKAIKRGW